MTITQRVVVITGANSGIGRETAFALAELGYELVLAGRHRDAMQPVLDRIATHHPQARARFLRLDLADLHGVVESAETLLADDDPIHVLINNAGVAGQRGVTTDGFELAFGTNHLGHFVFTQHLVDRLAASGNSRVVNVSSNAHLEARGIDWELLRRPTKSLTGLREYSVSKLCNVLFSAGLSARHDPQQLSSFALHPGVVSTNVWRRIPSPLLPVMRKVLKMVPADAGIVATMRAVTEPGLESHSGDYLDADGSFREVNPLVTPTLVDDLWRVSERWSAEVLTSYGPT